MKQRISFPLLIFILHLSSCQEEDFTTYQQIRFVNFTSLQIDTLTLSSDPQSKLEFHNLKAFSDTEYQEFTDLKMACYISLHYNDTSIERKWYMPSYLIDPAGESLLTRSPSGKYTFGIILKDTFSTDPGIVLESFKN